MRVLQEHELSMVAGGTGVCTPYEVGLNTYGGVRDTTTVGGDFINLYEGAVAAVSYVIERVARAF